MVDREEAGEGEEVEEAEAGRHLGLQHQGGKNLLRFLFTSNTGFSSVTIMEVVFSRCEAVSE